VPNSQFSNQTYFDQACIDALVTQAKAVPLAAKTVAASINFSSITGAVPRSSNKSKLGLRFIIF
jgi:hypothetical protein